MMFTDRSQLKYKKNVANMKKKSVYLSETEIKVK